MSQAAKRLSIRFDPDPVSYVLIDNSPAASGNFQAKLTGLLFNESYRGCAIIILKDQALEINCECLVRLAHLQNPLKAVVRWREDFDIGVSRIGLEYLEETE